MDLATFKAYLANFIPDGVALAFSGGVDSTLLLALLSSLTTPDSPQIMAATFHTPFHPDSELALIRRLAAQYRCRHQIIELNPLNIPEVENNDVQRCYFCKHAMFSALQGVAKPANLHTIIDGTNFDDLNVYRPGRRALTELGIHSPLAECHVSKAQLRGWAQELNIPVAAKPAAPCLATRFEYNTLITNELLQQVQLSEALLHQLLPTNSQLRLRVHNNLARIEVEPKNFTLLLQNHELIQAKLKEFGFDYVTLDLNGFCSGSMDLHVTNQ
ncbi:MAG: ATP-dependent sacrificial sulfur transferase LarE [Victivallaceae bacterium]